MTENEYTNEQLIDFMYDVMDWNDAEDEPIIYEIIEALKEIKQYRAIGTVEEVKNAYGRGYNQGSIDRAEELQKCREYGYNKAIDEVFDFLKTQRDKKSMKVNFDDLEIRKYKEQLKGGAE